MSLTALVGLALSSELRLSLLHLLGERDCTIGEIAAELGVSQSTASYHVSVLADAGLVIHDTGGRRHFVRRKWPRVEIAFDSG